MTYNFDIHGLRTLQKVLHEKLFAGAAPEPGRDEMSALPAGEEELWHSEGTVAVEPKGVRRLSKVEQITQGGSSKLEPLETVRDGNEQDFSATDDILRLCMPH